MQKKNNWRISFRETNAELPVQFKEEFHKLSCLIAYDIVTIKVIIKFHFHVLSC